MNDVPTREDDVLDRVKTVLSEHLGIEKDLVVPTAHLANDLGCDSLDPIEMTMLLEEHYGIEIPDDEADDCATVQDVVDLVTEKIAEKNRIP